MSIRKQAVALAVAAAFQPPLLAQTLPTGGAVAAGSATIAESPGNLFVSQGSDKAVINWQSFSIGQSGTVTFSQPGSSSVALNRVLGNNPSEIFGSLFANGRVFLVNPSGIYFAPGAQVSVGSLVASTLSISDDDFLAGRYLFSNGGGAGSVVNDAFISSHNGYTALLGTKVTNNGFIVANAGTVALAAGDRVSLDMVGDNLIRVSVDQATLDAAVVNTGNIDAFGGNVLLSAHRANDLLDTVLNTQGFVHASRIEEVGGEIVLHGGSRGTMALGGGVASDGHMSITGQDVSVSGSVLSSGGQTVAARSLAVSARAGSNAGLSNIGGDQRIVLTGDGTSGGLEVVSDGSAFASVSHFNDPAHGQYISVVDGDHIRVDGGAGAAGEFFSGAGIFASGSAQHISITGTGRNAIVLGSDGASGQSNIVALEQTIVAGTDDQAGSITLIGGSATNAFVGISTEGGSGPQTQSISTTGALRITGAQAPAQNTVAGIFHNRQGQQTIRAGDIEVLAADSGFNNGVFINVNGGADQRIEIAPGGTIRVIAGQGGANNTAGIGNQSSGNQTIVGNPDVFVAGGATSNASVQAGLGRTQTIEAHDITLTNGVGSPGNSAGVLLAPHQRITATGDVLLTASSGTGTASGVRIGGSSNGIATDLVLTVGGDLVLRGGTTGTNGAALGSAGTVPTGRNDVTVIATGDVILDGAMGGGGVRLGSSGLTPVQEGDISVTARSILFTGTAPAAIRTLGDVTLSAGSIEQAPSGLIVAGGLTTASSGATSLVGQNQVSRFSGSTGSGGLTLNNSGPLDVSFAFAPNATLTNAGPVHISGLWNTVGNTAITTTGTGSSLLVTDTVFANGEMNVDVSGDFIVRGSGFPSANVASSGDQTINVTGGSFDLEGRDGAFAQIASHGGNQTVTVRDGDHLRIVSENGAFTGMSAAGTQTLSITGSGRNAMEVGSEGGTGSIFVSAPTLRLTAGIGSESGSITITGPAAPGTSVQVGAGFPFPMPGEQTISTTGALTVAGGSRPGDAFITTGIVHNGFGPQRISAGSLELRGGAEGSGNVAAIVSIAGGEQLIDVGGDLVLLGGPGGPAQLFANAAQSISASSLRLQGALSGANGGAFVNGVGQDIDVSGDIIVAGGGGGNNGSGIHSNDALQSIRASNLSLQGSSSGSNNGAFVTTSPGASQYIEVPGRIDVVTGDAGTGNGAGLNSRGSQTIVGRPDIRVIGGAGASSAAIQGLGGLQQIEARSIFMTNAESSPVNSAAVIQSPLQRIDVSGDVTLVARSGTGSSSGVRIGSQGAGATDLELKVGGNLLLRGGTSGTNGSALGSSGTTPTNRNDVRVMALGDVILDGADGGAGVRLGSSALTPVQDGNISVTARSILFTGTAPAAIRTLGDVTLSAGSIQQEANGLILASGLTTASEGSTLLGGANDVSSFGGVAGGDLLLRNLSSFLTLGPVDAAGALTLDQAGSLFIGAGESSLVVRGGTVNVATGGDLALRGGTGYRARAELVSGGDIDATIGGVVTLDKGLGDETWARIRSEGEGSVMRFAFPNLTSGGFFVDGVEGSVKHGLSGFYILNKPVKIGQTLLLEYQE